VLRTLNDQPTLWELILPEECLGLPPALAEVDRLLDDPRFFEPFRPFFTVATGRPSTPMETYLRMMFLRFRYDLGFERLCAEVIDSLAWRRFCRIPLGERVPHPSTLEKITARCGPEAIEGLNEALLAKAADAGVVRLDKARADTTVVEANVAYPTDSGLLARGVARMAVIVAALQKLGLAARTKSRDRTRSVRRRAHDIAAWLRRRSDDAKEEVRRINAEMADIADTAVGEARAVAGNAGRTLGRLGQQAPGRAVALVAELDRLSGLVEQVAAQTRVRLGGEVPDGSTRVVSLHDPDARPIAKGRLGKPVEFGFKAQVVDNVDGIVIDHTVVMGNPADAPMLAPAIARVKRRFGRAPAAVTADRGYGEAKIDAELQDLGVKRIYIPRKGKPTAARHKVQRSRGFVKMVKWRTGSEARISCLKRDNGWRRTRFDGLGGAQTWCGFGVLAHNAVKIAFLIEAQPANASPSHSETPAATAQGRARAGPPGKLTKPIS
jgi:IS5 family transposase